MGAFLYDHQNPHAPVRTNGKRFWGYPAREGLVDPTIVAVHTTESALDVIGDDAGAENVARYQAGVERPSSYHRLVDRDSNILMLPDEAVSFGVAGYNTRALNISFAMRAAEWADPAKAAAAEAALRNAAPIVAGWCIKYRIPVSHRTKAQIDAGMRGITGHGVLDPGRRSDPGASFPWAHFLDLVRAAMGGSVEEDDMGEYLDRTSSESAIKLVQRCLKAEGAASGRKDSQGVPTANLVVDGDWGPATDRALDSYATGRVHGRTAGRLGGVLAALLFRWEP